MKFKDRAMSSMQNFARAMFMPVLILPIVGLLIAVANLFTNASLIQDVPFLNNPVTIGFGTILSGCMQPILSNLGLIFAVGVSIGLAKEKKSDAAFISVLTYVVFLNAMNKYMNLRGLLAPADALRGTTKNLSDYVNEISAILQCMATGDLTEDSDEITDFLGDFASIKESFVHILKRFNSTLTNIQTSAD